MIRLGPGIVLHVILSVVVFVLGFVFLQTFTQTFHWSPMVVMSLGDGSPQTNGKKKKQSSQRTK